MGKKYKTLLFDADGTLLDFEAAEKEALRSLFRDLGEVLSPEIESRYKELNHGLWRAYEEGTMERDEVVNTRFARLFKEFGKDVDGARLERIYQGYLEQGCQLIVGAMELIMSLRDRYKLYIVTNGVSTTQDRRLRESGLLPLFQGVFVSEDTGYQKPMKEYFDYVFARIPGFVAEETLLIGDSFNADIVGGYRAGLDTCWINPTGKPNTSDITPTYEIRRLDELNAIL